jgi:hypothetical protein
MTKDKILILLLVALAIYIVFSRREVSNLKAEQAENKRELNLLKSLVVDLITAPLPELSANS